MDVRKITKSDCLNWAARFGKDYALFNFNNTAGTLSEILDNAVEAGVRYENPARHIKRAKIEPRKLNLPNPDQFLALVDAIENSKACFCKQAADLIRFFAYSGCRKSETAAVMWADVNIERGEILLRFTKNGEHRRIPMIEEMRELLARLKEGRSDAEAHDTVMPIKECQTSLDNACKKVGVPRITHHDLRHLFATRGIESGVDVPTVSRWLGHKDGGALAMKIYGVIASMLLALR